MEKLVLHKRPPYRPNALPALWQDFPDSKHGRGLHGTYPRTANVNEHRSLWHRFSVLQHPASKGEKAPDEDQAPSRKVFRQKVDALYWFSTRRRFTNSPKPAGKLWCELLRDNLKAAGYTQKPNDTTVWRRIERDREGRTTALSIALVFVDDFLHAWWVKSSETSAIRDRLHLELGKREVPWNAHGWQRIAPSCSLDSASRGYPDSVSSFHSRDTAPPSSRRTRTAGSRTYSPLPLDFNSRTLSEEDMAPLDEDKITLYRKQIMSIAWLVRQSHKSRPTAQRLVISITGTLHIS